MDHHVQVICIGQNGKLRIGDHLIHLERVAEGDHPIAVAHDDEDGIGDAFEIRLGVIQWREPHCRDLFDKCFVTTQRETSRKANTGV